MAQSMQKKGPRVPNPDSMVVDQFRKDLQNLKPRGAPSIVGRAICGGPFEAEIVLDFTGLRGSGSNIYYSLIYQVPKWNYHIKKVDEWIEVTPTFAEYYNITIAQKQKLEASIKQGLTSAAQSVADYELLMHDFRRYREMLDYFIQADKSKDEHILRSLFVDRVDAHTGEGYSMITMAKRWPTIITDFIRMKGGWADRAVIRKELDVTDAEATVLITKNQLYEEWKKLFLPTIKDRVSRLQVLVESRKKSIDEYRDWLKPYMAQYKMIREKAEVNPKENLHSAFFTPGFGQSQAMTGVRLWFWKPYYPPQKGKAEMIVEGKKNRGFMIDPYDDIAKAWKGRIEEHYGVTITDKEVDEILDKAAKEPPKGTINPAMDRRALYYTFFDARVTLGLTRTPPPEGQETDNLMFQPLKMWMMSQNVVLVHLLELYAKEKAFEKNINTLIGSREAEEAALQRIEKEFQPPGEEKQQRLRTALGGAAGRVKPPLEALFYLFVKRGPYEPVFYERVTKTYNRGAGGVYGQMVDFLMQKMGAE